MPGTHPRTSHLGIFMHTAAEDARRGRDTPRLTVDHMGCSGKDFDTISVLADDLPGRDAVRAIAKRKRTYPCPDPRPAPRNRRPGARGRSGARLGTDG